MLVDRRYISMILLSIDITLTYWVEMESFKTLLHYVIHNNLAFIAIQVIFYNYFKARCEKIYTYYQYIILPSIIAPHFSLFHMTYFFG